MKKSGVSKVKYIVLAGYTLVVIILIAGLFSVYNNLVDFSDKKLKQEDMSELLIVGNTLSKLYEIESSQNLFNADNAGEYFHRYDSVLPEIARNLDTLKMMTEDTARIVKLDSIRLLMTQKNQNLQEVAILLDSIQKSPRITRRTTSSIVPRQLNSEISDYLESRNLRPADQLQSDTSVVMGERRGFLARVRDVFVARTDSTVMIEKRTTVPDAEFRLIVDTVVNMVRYSERLDLERQRQFQNALAMRQTSMSNTNTLLTLRIDELLKGIEQEELAKSVQLVQYREKALSNSQRTMYFVSWLSLFIAVVFGILFLVDVNRSQRYRRQLEVSNARISELLALREKIMLTISHDIKAPMSSILGYIELMNTDVSREKRQVYLDNMKNSSEHVLQLVSTLLDYHKLEAGTWLVRENNFSVRNLVSETSASFKPLALKKGLVYEEDNNIPKTLVSFGDPYIMRQIISNILSNAIKYTLSGSVLMKARVEERAEAKWLVFSVKDTGVGIAQADQRAVFQEFHRLTHGNPDNRIEGTGLGLAITRAFVEELQGVIHLDSALGKGSEFIVELPLKTKRQLQDTRQDADGTAETDLQGIRVLVVDDDSIQLMMTHEMLELKKVDTVTESEPEKALIILKNKQFDIVFLDIQMPKMNGFELVEKIRKLKIPYAHSLPVIALSAKSGMNKTDIRHSGFTDFLTKPFTSAQLYDIIHRCVNAPEQTAESAALSQTGSAAENAKGAEALVEFVRDDKDTSVEILRTFVRETTLQIEQMEDAFARNDTEAAGRVSHKMLPLFRMMGNEELVALMSLAEQGESLSEPERQTALRSLKHGVAQAEQLQKEMERQ